MHMASGMIEDVYGDEWPSHKAGKERPARCCLDDNKSIRRFILFLVCFFL